MSHAESVFLFRVAIIFGVGMVMGLAGIAWALITNRRDRQLPPAE